MEGLATMTAEGAGTEEKGQNSREQRVGKMVLAHMRSARLPEHDVVVRNISSHGLCIRSKAELPELGEQVSIRFDALGEVHGVIRWVHGTNFGVQLDEELDPSRFQFADKSWEFANREFEANHVYTQFKPEVKTWRPGLKPR